MASSTVWVVVADGGAARFFRRSDVHEPLEEMKSLAMRAESSLDAQQRPRRTDAVGRGRRASLHQHDEDVFLRRLAADIDRIAHDHSIAKLALCASPAALGRLRNDIAANTRRLLVCEIANDLIHERVDAIDARMRGHRL